MSDLVVSHTYRRRRACRRRQAFVVVPFAVFFPRAAVPLPRWSQTTKQTRTKEETLAQGCLATVGRVDAVFLSDRFEFHVLYVAFALCCRSGGSTLFSERSTRVSCAEIVRRYAIKKGDVRSIVRGIRECEGRRIFLNFRLIGRDRLCSWLGVPESLYQL